MTATQKNHATGSQKPLKPISRRRFFESAAVVAGGTTFCALMLAVLPLRSHAAWTPRPPGALAGDRFLAACARCGQCVKACPYGTLKLAAMPDLAPIGTPYFTPREIPCYMCKDLLCVKACPTGALDPKLQDIADARMGVAVIDPQSCLSWQGLRCEVCFRECPEASRALTIDPHPRELSKHAVFVPIVHPDRCTGCGLCEKSCPTDVPAIRIVDPETVLGVIGAHYRLGWLSEDDPKNSRRIAPSSDSDSSAKSTPIEKSDSNSIPGLDYLNSEDHF